jgi:hypothetical protein
MPGRTGDETQEAEGSPMINRIWPLGTTLGLRLD